MFRFSVFVFFGALFATSFAQDIDVDGVWHPGFRGDDEQQAPANRPKPEAPTGAPGEKTAETTPAPNATAPCVSGITKCSTNAECGGVNGKFTGPRCIGPFNMNKCKCEACVAGLPCKDDSACGNLKGSCSFEKSTGTGPEKKGVCDCMKAAHDIWNSTHPSERQPTLALAISKFCLETKCDDSPNACWGLPCNQGTCFQCPLALIAKPKKTT